MVVMVVVGVVVIVIVIVFVRVIVIMIVKVVAIVTMMMVVMIVNVMMKVIVMVVMSVVAEYKDNGEDDDDKGDDVEALTDLNVIGSGLGSKYLTGKYAVCRVFCDAVLSARKCYVMYMLCYALAVMRDVLQLFDSAVTDHRCVML
jgi:hypothetical protein